MLRSVAALLLALTATAAGAQTNVAIGGLSADPTAPVEVTADNLTVDQASGAATFEGNVVIGQGALKISAATVEVFYDDASGDIARMVAGGGVTFVTATEAAESQDAVYDLSGGTLTLTGDVLLTQGASAISAQSMVVDLAGNTARLEGGVRTVLNRGTP